MERKRERESKMKNFKEIIIVSHEVSYSSWVAL